MKIWLTVVLSSTSLVMFYEMLSVFQSPNDAKVITNSNSIQRKYKPEFSPFSNQGQLHQQMDETSKKLQLHKNDKEVIVKPSIPEHVRAKSEIPVKQTPNVLLSCHDDTECSIWKENFFNKVNCVTSSCGAIYLYHVRKAGGTSIRQMLQYISESQYVAFRETEGLVLNSELLGKRGLMTFISLRDPIDRILSLYWYEHAYFYHRIKNTPSMASTLRVWVDTWRDRHPWKQSHTLNNPHNNYIDIENYYVKSLIGWDGSFKITRDHLQLAKTTLSKFDSILISEWLGLPISQHYFDLLYSDDIVSTTAVNLQSFPHALTADKAFIQSVKPSLAPDWAQIRNLLRDINTYDIELYQYAQALVKQRSPILLKMRNSKQATRHSVNLRAQLAKTEDLKKLEDLRKNNLVTEEMFATMTQLTVQKYRTEIMLEVGRRCSINSNCRLSLTQSMSQNFGCFRPPGHKQPIALNVSTSI